MPYAIYASFNKDPLKNTSVIMQLVNRSNAYPKCVVENVLIEVT